MKTFGALSFRPHAREWVMTDVPPHVVIRLKQFFQRIPKAQPAPFIFPHTPSIAADLAWFLDRYPMRMSDEDRATLTDEHLAFKDRLGEMERILSPDYQPTTNYKGLREGMAVRPYQAQAIEILMRSGGLALCDAVGLGKSFVTAGAMLNEAARPGVIVCQTHLQAQWANVIRNFTTLFPYPIKGTKPYDIPSIADVIIIRYSQLVGWADYPWNIGLLTFDEIQELRSGVGTDSNPVQKGLAARRMANAARYKLGLSATPIYNYGDEMFNIMMFLNEQVLGSRGDFLREWCNGGKSISDKEALGEYLREEFALLRRTKKDVGQEMDPVNRVVKTIEHDHKAVESAEELARQLAVKATSGEFTERGQAIRELDVMMRKLTGIAKAKAVAHYVRMIVEGGEPVVLFGWHRDVYDIWLEELSDLRPVMYTGSETAAKKEVAKNAFLKGETDIIILSLRSGAGLDGLQYRSSTAVFGELDWSPGVHEQCVGRLYREGQKNPVTAIFLVADDGADPPMMEILGMKANEAQQILDPSADVLDAPVDESKLRKLVERYLTKKAGARSA